MVPCVYAQHETKNMKLAAYGAVCEHFMGTENHTIACLFWPFGSAVDISSFIFAVALYRTQNNSISKAKRESYHSH